ncbi:hypothetical protein [Anaerovorax odorimutans]|uniref:hypothetical protein n=1 Tax=Anaerovorax odorimutans TaxID=109327 RepID=UPI0004130E36|nr:hypothetical protein [Anaerovorax odorimutans]
MKIKRKVFKNYNIKDKEEYLFYKKLKNEENRKEVYNQFEEEVCKYDIEHLVRLLDYAKELVSEAESIYTEIGIEIFFLIKQDRIKKFKSLQRLKNVKK